MWKNKTLYLLAHKYKYNMKMNISLNQYDENYKKLSNIVLSEYTK